MQAKIVRSDDTFRMQFCGGDTGTLIMTRARRRLQQTAALVSLPCWCLTHHAATTVDSEDFLPHATLQVCCLDSRGGISGAHSPAVSTFTCCEHIRLQTRRSEGRREGVIGRKQNLLFHRDQEQKSNGE
jgi:hypothetical protein